MTPPRDTVNPHDRYGGMREASHLPQEAKDFLAEVLPPERDSKGKFRRGKLGGPGGQRRTPYFGLFNFRKLVVEYIERNGGNVEDTVAELFEDLMNASDRGDTNATRILVDRLCGKETEQLDVTVATTKLSESDRLARLRTLFSRARERRDALDEFGIERRN